MVENLEKYYGCIYITTNMINGKQYTGKSIKIKDVLEGKYKGSGDLITKAFKKYGFENFKCEIIEYVYKVANLSKLEHKRLLGAREIHWIEINNTLIPIGYNIANGGEGGNLIENLPKEHQIMINKKKSRKGDKHGMYNKGFLVYGERNGMYGKTHSKEIREKISKSRLGTKATIETKKKMSDSRKNLKHILKNVKCPYCSFEGRGPNMSRYHFDKCKYKNINKSYYEINNSTLSKEELKILKSKRFIGENNPMYGKKGKDHNHFGSFWVTNGKLNKKLCKGCEIPIGFYKGRVFIKN